jgi:hypothetical protein
LARASALREVVGLAAVVGVAEEAEVVVAVAVVAAAAGKVVAFVVAVEVCSSVRNFDAHVLERQEAWMIAAALPYIPAGAGDLEVEDHDTERRAAAVVAAPGYAEACLVLVVGCTSQVAACTSSHS